MMDFITKLPRNPHGMGTISVIVNMLTKSDHFLPIQDNSSAEKLTKIYIKEVFSRHGVPVLIIFNIDVHFTYRFSSKFHVELSTRLHISITYHPQTGGQSERMIQNLEE